MPASGAIPSKSAAARGAAEPMSLWKNYHLAKSIQHALKLLSESPEPVALVAGGTDLLLDLQQGRHPPVSTLIDITHVPEMTRLDMEGGRLFIGAAVPVGDIASSPLVRRHAEAVAEGCALIGGPQVRNTATLGGNVAHALPAADGMIGLLALDAQALVANQQGLREMPLLNLFKGPGQNTLDPKQDILVGFYLLEHETGQASAFRRIMRPQGVALPIQNIAVWLQRSAASIQKIRVAIGPAGPTPQRAWSVEEFLTGRTFDPDTCHKAIEVLKNSVHFRSSPYRATAEYRYQICGILLERALTLAWQRSEGARRLE